MGWPRLFQMGWPRLFQMGCTRLFQMGANIDQSNRLFYYPNCSHSQKNAWKIVSISSYKRIRLSIMLSSIKISCLRMLKCFVFCDRATHLIWIWSNRADHEWKEKSLV
jgi:hypothetical protein